MLGYVPEVLTRFQHTAPCIPQHQPYPHAKPTYGTKSQYTEDVDTSPPLDKKGKKYIQEVIGTYLYYARCVNSTVLLALGFLATQQANPMQNTKKLVHQFLDYATTHPNATWYLLVTAIPSTFWKPMHAAGQVDISSCPTTMQFPATLEQSSQPCKSSKRSCHPQRKQKSQLSTSTAEKPSQLDTHLNT
jgi:hypothetical protein